jgi:glycosyltransferase involved in cell wall biosynthesis
MERQPARKGPAFPLPAESCGVAVACPDARPPAYQAVAGLAASGRLARFITGYYDRGRLPAGLRPGHVERYLARRRMAGIPAGRVEPHAAFDVALAVENRLGVARPGARRSVARWRTRAFDRAVWRSIERRPPGALLAFSDVASDDTLPRCRDLGIPTVLSMVHGDVREERLVLATERERSPEWFGLYLADGPIDDESLAWLHERRLSDLEHADRVLVPSEHIAGWLARHGTARERIRVIPYAADVARFHPVAGKAHDPARCTFLFAGGITQRKGISYLLEAWRRVRRPGWRLQLLGGLPGVTGPLEPYRDEVEWLGRVGHGEVAQAMARADVFVFPSLFEGSAVVTYEALACGLPSIVSGAAGSVVRDGLDGRVIEAGQVEPLAEAMIGLGTDAGLRACMSESARERAMEFTWERYQAATLEALDDLAPLPRPGLTS